MKLFKNHLLGIIAITILIIGVFGSAAPKMTTGTIKFTPKDDDLYTKDTIVKFIKSNKDVSIVLRTTSSVANVLVADKAFGDKIYNTIETELTKANFDVRDRSLFQHLIDQNKVSDYSKIKELTNTDLILEFIGFEKVTYTTNEYLDVKGKRKTINSTISMTGTKIDFKLISIKDNTIVGTYTYYTAPCINGCTYRINEFGALYPLSSNSKGKNSAINTSEYDKEDLVLFIQSSIRKLILELRK